MITTAESWGPAQSQCALTPVLSPLLHPSRTRSIPWWLLLSGPCMRGGREDLGVGKGREVRRGYPGWSPQNPGAGYPGWRRESVAPEPGQPRGIIVFRSWLQTLASWMPSVDERCIME